MGDELSEYTFGDMSYSGGQPSDGQHSGVGEGQAEQSPKWFRDYMAQAKQQNEQLQAQIQELTAEKRQTEIGNAFEAKGYARAAAALYQGEPDKVDDWLSTHGGALARTGGAMDIPPQQGSRPPGEMRPAQQAPAVAPSAQADLQKMQQMGQGVAVAQANSDDELAAALAATQTPEQFQQVAAAHGWQYNLGNMGFS